VARGNAHRLGAVWGLRLALGDLFSAVGPTERFELVTANPPYIPEAEIAELPEDIRHFEPRLALDGGPSGLNFYERICREALAHLTRGGVLALEVGFGQAASVAALLEAAGYTSIETTRDYGGVPRVVSAKAPDVR
jgi:release factor glutamine methyltransferase